MTSREEGIIGAIGRWLISALPDKAKRDEILLKAAAGIQETGHAARETMNGVWADLKLARADDFSSLSVRCSRLARRLNKLDARLASLTANETKEAVSRKASKPKPKRRAASPKKAQNKS